MRAALAALAVLLVAGCGGTGGLAEPGSVSEGQRLFTTASKKGPSCASCHALDHAGSQAQVGPDLDAAFVALRDEGYDDSTIREVVHKQILYPVEEPPTGEPGMPANLVEGEEADAVAAYVACVAGRDAKEWEEQGCGPSVAASGGTAAGSGGAGDAQASDPKALFASAGCAGCHALAAADASGSVGPDLDESDVSETEAMAQIENGGDGMPAYRGRLEPDQIRALARFIVRNRGQ